LATIFFQTASTAAGTSGRFKFIDGIGDSRCMIIFCMRLSPE
jgi:hypothetical protein